VAAVEFACRYRWWIAVCGIGVMLGAMLACPWICKALDIPIKSEPEGPAVFVGLMIAGPLCALMFPLMVLCPWLIVCACRLSRKVN
jgi:hypothetical protein